jgi:hydroxyacylglutathione hydrolase
METVVGYVTEPDNLDRAALPQISVAELRDRELPVLDVRRRTEYESGHVPGAQSISLDELPQRTTEVDRQSPLAVICGSGYRSSIAASLLMREGFVNLMNVTDGTSGWVRAGYRVE